MRGLTILVVGDDAERLHAALTYAAAGAAIGGAVCLHLHEGAVALLRSPMTAPADAARDQAGLPTLRHMFEEALDLGVTITVCQSGLALTDIDMRDLDPRIEAQGPVGMLSTLDDARLLTF